MNKVLLTISLIFVSTGIWQFSVDGYSSQTLIFILFFGTCGLYFAFRKRIENWSEKNRAEQTRKKYCRVRDDHFEFPKGYCFRHTSLQDLNKLAFSDIEKIRLTFTPCAKINKRELIFLLGLTEEEIEKVANEKQIAISKAQDNWYLICEEFLDTEFDPKHKIKTLEKLNDVGLSMDEVTSIGKRFSKRILIQTLFSMEWVYYGQFDILEQIIPLTKEKYWWTMNIVLRE